jgi:hypothetical protein
MVFFSLLILQTQTTAISPSEIIQNIKANQNKVKDFQAYYTQTINSSLMGNKTSIEKGRYFTKGKKTRKEIQSPNRKLIITTDSFIYEKDLTTGQEYKTELTDSQISHQNIDTDEIMDQCDFVIKEETNDFFYLQGDYQNNKIELEITKDFLINKLSLFMNNKPFMVIDNDYKKISSNNVLIKSVSKITLDMNGNLQTIVTSMVYKGVKVNLGVEDGIFEI